MIVRGSWPDLGYGACVVVSLIWDAFGLRLVAGLVRCICDLFDRSLFALCVRLAATDRFNDATAVAEST